MSDPIPELLGVTSVDDAGNIRWQVAVNLDVSTTYASAWNRNTLEAPICLRLGFPEKYIPKKLRLQARVIVDQDYNPSWNSTTGNVQTPRYSDLRFDAAICPQSASLTNWYAEVNQLGYAEATGLLFSEPRQVWQRPENGGSFIVVPWPIYREVPNDIDFTFDIDDSFQPEFWLGMRVTLNPGGTRIAPTNIPNATNESGVMHSSRQVKIQIHAITVEGYMAGCDGVTVMSLDGRLVSTTDDRVIEYPMIFLHRPPMREDAKGFKEVLVFQDRATTIRVYPQPLILNEENNYVTQATIESNGHWSLYDYDADKLSGSLESGRPFTEGTGNDTLVLTKNPDWAVYGLYDLKLLYVTDTDDEPYVVPVILDYAKPLTVWAPPQVTEPQTRLVTIEFDDFTRRIDLHISRDRVTK